MSKTKESRTEWGQNSREQREIANGKVGEPITGTNQNDWMPSIQPPKDAAMNISSQSVLQEVEESLRQPRQQYHSVKFIPLGTVVTTEQQDPKSVTLETATEKNHTHTDSLLTTESTEHERMNPSSAGTVQPKDSIISPYLYERQNDPKTRYIPLVPIENLYSSNSVAGMSMTVESASQIASGSVDQNSGSSYEEQR
ncbi:hypothetical protein QAD02_010402 [Eretmocerus hayati]|uniref:Uncharacterized protein n=1 Tax=Eretmocerus hayati TaxID=131215 RepID=A0ACC2NBY0_9HYME|nr:hypothetical protein QAD02_010402 [Eretmocerus hayati]